jgi:negative regulator of flagellin synthesis FlgM
MKINNSHRRLAPAAVGTSEKRPVKTSDRHGDDKALETSINLSLFSRSLVSESRLATEVVNRERVEEIKLAIAEGRFKVNAEVVAHRLLRTAKEMLRAHRA